MRVEIDNAIYEDTLNNLILTEGHVTHTKCIYECACGEHNISKVKLNYDVKLPSYEYTYNCGCGNSIKVFVKNVRFEPVKE